MRESPGRKAGTSRRLLGTGPHYAHFIFYARSLLRLRPPWRSLRRFSQLAFDDRPDRLPGPGSDADDQGGTDHELDQQQDQVGLLAAHLATGIGGTAARTGQGGSIDLMAAGAAGN